MSLRRCCCGCPCTCDKMSVSIGFGPGFNGAVDSNLSCVLGAINTFSPIEVVGEHCTWSAGAANDTTSLNAELTFNGKSGVWKFGARGVCNTPGQPTFAGDVIFQSDPGQGCDSPLVLNYVPGPSQPSFPNGALYVTVGSECCPCTPGPASVSVACSAFVGHTCTNLDCAGTPHGCFYDCDLTALNGTYILEGGLCTWSGSGSAQCHTPATNNPATETVTLRLQLTPVDGSPGKWRWVLDVAVGAISNNTFDVICFIRALRSWSIATDPISVGDVDCSSIPAFTTILSDTGPGSPPINASPLSFTAAPA